MQGKKSIPHGKKSDNNFMIKLNTITNDIQKTITKQFSFKDTVTAIATQSDLVLCGKTTSITSWYICACLCNSCRLYSHMV